MNNGDVTSGRVVFISLSALMRTQVPADVLENALFFFGSKRFWLWPTDDAERKESKAQPTDYLNMCNELKDLILRKEKRGEVCFLKPDVLGAPDEVVFGDYARASRWLEERGYNPLRLDSTWWESSSNDKSWRSVVANFERGLHDYEAVTTLLARSDPRLEPFLFWKSK